MTSFSVDVIVANTSYLAIRSLTTFNKNNHANFAPKKVKCRFPFYLLSIFLVNVKKTKKRKKKRKNLMSNFVLAIVQESKGL